MPETPTDVNDVVVLTFEFPRTAWEGEGGITDAIVGNYNADPEGTLTTSQKNDFTINKVKEFLDENWKVHHRKQGTKTYRAGLDSELDTQSELIKNNTKTTKETKTL